MKKRILSAFIAAAMVVCCFSGCTDSENKQSNESAAEQQTTEKVTEEETEITEAETEKKTQATETEASTAEENKETDLNPFEFEDFSLTSADDFTIDDSEEFGGADLCLVYNKAPVTVSFIEAASSYGVTSYGHAESYAADIEDNSDCSDITFKKCHGYPMDTSVVNYVTTESGKRAIVDMYYICEQDSQIGIIVMYTEGFESDAQKAADKIIKSLDYTSDFYYPTETQTFENDYFSVVYEPNWFLNGNKSTDYNYEFKVKYIHTDSFINAFSSYSVQVLTDTEYDNAEEYANSRYEHYIESESDFYHNIQTGKEDIFGIPAYKVAISLQTNSYLYHNYEFYYFDYNDEIYSVSMGIPINDDGTIAEAVQKLIDNTTIK